MRIAAIASSLFVAGFIIGCSDVGFKSVPSATCVSFNQAEDQNCTFTPEGNIYSVTFKTGLLDILVVNDNSGSMSREQEKMANAFSGFLNSIQDFEYQIAMVTTDVENGGGNLLTFVDENGNASGEKVLKKGTPNILSKFKGTIQRQETLACDNNRYAPESCPSNDERGIYAANLAISRNEAGWLRSGAHTAIIALSDEDQRGRTKWSDDINDWVGAIQGYDLEANDYPETLVSNFTSKYSAKSLSVHPIIVRPNDTTCYNAQKTYFDLQGRPLQHALLGAYGYLWNDLARASTAGLNEDENGNPRNIINGTVGNICSSTYYNQLNLIGSYSASSANQNVIQMQCLPASEDITVEAAQSVNYYVDEQNMRIVFDSNLPIGLEIKVSWKCDNTI